MIDDQQLDDGTGLLRSPAFSPSDHNNLVAVSK
jgi:hypothetical protein